MFSVVVGTTAVATFTFTTHAGALADPTTVSVVVETPAGVQTTETYNPGDITRVSEGVYELGVPATEAGVWTLQPVGTGTVAVVACSTFVAEAACL